MDLCSPHVVIRVLALCGLSLFCGGLWLVRVAETREKLVDTYNGYVTDWTNVYLKEFERANFIIEMGLAVNNASVHYYGLAGDGGDLDQNMIPAGYYPDLEEYTPLQYISDSIWAYDVVKSSNKIKPIPAGQLLATPINVTLVVTTIADPMSPRNTTTQRMHVGSFQLVGEWPADPKDCDGAADDLADADQVGKGQSACTILRAVHSLCLVVSWRGAEERWAWRSSGKGCFVQDVNKGFRGWVLADDVREFRGNIQSGVFDFGAGVFEEHDPFLMVHSESQLDMLMSSPALEADACLICGSILVTIFVVHWTVCEKMDDGELDRELTRILIATGAASAPPDRATQDRIFRRRREAERRARDARRAEAELQAQAEAEAGAGWLDDQPDEDGRGAYTTAEHLHAEMQGSEDEDASTERDTGGSDGSTDLDASVAVRRTTADDR